LTTGEILCTALICFGGGAAVGLLGVTAILWAHRRGYL
jgi:hypothetical protein